MTCDLETPGGRRAIEFRRRGSAWEMTLDGRILSVDVTATGGRWSLLIGPDASSRRSYEVAVERRSNGERIVYVNGLAVPVSIVDPRERLVQRRGNVSDGTGPRSIVSPMPGRIVKVLVREGDVVAAQQGLGALIQNASAYFLLDVIYVGIICIGLIALLMDLALRRASARLVAWQERI